MIKFPTTEPRQHIVVRFAHGERILSRTTTGPTRVRAVKRAAHGDWKTQLVREHFMGLDAGEEAELVEVFDNLYGRWMRVRRADGQTADVESHLLEVLP